MDLIAAQGYARKKLARIVALEAAGLLNRIQNYGQLSPVEQLAQARGKDLDSLERLALARGERK